jgi:AcrR family transcriptional regulator
MTETTARRNRPYAPRLSPEQRHEQLLDLVLEIVDADGVGGVSMDAVARRAGVTRPVVYSHFTDTNHMLRASLDREEQRALAQLDDAMPRPGDEDLAASFHHVFDAYLRAVVEAPQRWRAIFMIADSGTPTFHRRVARIRARIVREFEAALRQSCTPDQQSDPAMLAHHLLAVLWESGRLLLVSPKDFTHERLLGSLDAMFTAIAAQRRKDPC